MIPWYWKLKLRVSALLADLGIRWRRDNKATPYTLRIFHAREYPHGCRCSNCSKLFKDKDFVADVWMKKIGDSDVVTPYCFECTTLVKT